jgi:DNA-binding NarL/FixJ family response regulator/REP element-mobilizing transposase RayT
MQTHILIINHQLAFAVSIKQALERTGNFEVHPFTSLEPALEYLRGHMQDVALVDFTLPGVSGSQVVERLRRVQPMLAIIATPSQPESLLQDLKLQGTVNTPISAREIIPVVNKAIEGRRTGRLASETAAPGTFTPARPDHPTTKTPTAPGEQKKPAEARPGLLGKIDEGELIRRLQTRPSKSKPPTDLPEYTSIDNVLSSVSKPQAQPPAEQPSEAKHPDLFAGDAVSQSIDDLLQNAAEPPAPDSEEDAFSALLVDLDSGAEQPQEGSEFDELVKSMRSDEPHQPLPTRHQQFVEFILTGGMDSLLEEIERKKTDELPALDQQTIVFDAPEPEVPVEDMPVLPAIEDEEQDEGTVGDLFTGVSDTGFRNVLTILRGEEVPPGEPAQEQVTEQDMREAFPQFFGSNSSEIDDLLDEVEAEAQREVIRSRDPGYDFDDEPGINTARLILETTLDESTPIDSFSVSELIRNIERQLPAHRPKVQPLPSWLQADKQRKEDADLFVREPDFLPDVLPEFPPSAPDEPAAALEEFEHEDEYDQTTRLSSAQRLETAPEALETEWLSPEALPEAEAAEDIDPFDFSFDSEPVADAEVEAVPQETEGYTPTYSEEEIGATIVATPQETSFEAVKEREETPVVAVEQPQDADLESMAAFETEGVEVVSPAAQGIDDPYLAQLALSLTEVSLELTAEATLLTREGQIVAYAGRMAREEVEELRAAIQGDWDANPDEARIRFINLEGSGKDYMLFSRRTVDDLTLSLIFSGTTPLRDIRRQGKRLIEALQAVPEVVEEPEPEEELLPEPVDDGRVRTPYAYVWIIRDPDTQISNSVAQAIVRGMNKQLREDAWHLQEIQAKEEYVYLLADVPGETPPYEVIRDLKRRSAEIAYSHNPTLDPNTLWADSYLVVTPGRKLDVDEIQEFIQFERML